MENYLAQLLKDITYATENINSPYPDTPTGIWDWISNEEEDKTAPRISLEEWTGIQQEQLPPEELLSDQQVKELYEALEKMLLEYNYAIVFVISMPIRIKYKVLQTNFRQTAIQKRWHDGFFETCKENKSHPDCLMGEYCHCAFFEEMFKDMIDEDLTPEEERARDLEMEITYLKRKHGRDWMKYYPYHLDPNYDDEFGNPYDYGIGDWGEEEDEDDWWKK